MSKLIYALATLVAWAMCAPALAQGVVEVRLPPEAVVLGDRIWLGEVAQISGPAGDAAEVKRRLDHVSLGPAPRPGESRILTQGTVETRLRSALGDPESFIAVVPERVEITRAATWIPVDQLRLTVERWITSVLGLPGAQVRVSELGVKGPIPVPVGPFQLRIEDGGEVPVGSTAVTIAVWQRGAEVSRQRVSCRVEVTASVVVAARAIPRGQTLEADDLDVVSRALTRLTAMPFGAPRQALGMETRKAIPAGAILTEGDVVLPDDVNDKDAVTVWVRSRSLTLSAPGEARGSGRVGDTIPVWCPSTEKILKARILGPGEVEIPYRAPGE